MATVCGGVVEGMRAAGRDLGVRCRPSADASRRAPPDMARQMVEEVLENRVDELIGLGMDGAEAPDPPEKFAEAFALARRGGARLTSHASADPPPGNIPICLDTLGCARVDHRYHSL